MLPDGFGAWEFLAYNSPYRKEGSLIHSIQRKILIKIFGLKLPSSFSPPKGRLFSNIYPTNNCKNKNALNNSISMWCCFHFLCCISLRGTQNIVIPPHSTTCNRHHPFFFTVLCSLLLLLLLLLLGAITQLK